MRSPGNGVAMSWILDRESCERHWDGDDADFPKLPKIGHITSASISGLVPDEISGVCETWGTVLTDVNWKDTHDVARASAKGEYLDGYEVWLRNRDVSAMPISREDRRSMKTWTGWEAHVAKTRNGIFTVKAHILDRSRGWIALPNDEYERMFVRRNIRKLCYNACVLERRFKWSVSIRSDEKLLALRFPTDAVGIRELLKDRDRPDSGRRSPLLHWVRSHVRKNRSDPSVTHEVRRSLRGARIVDWHGFIVEVRESELEREQLISRTV